MKSEGADKNARRLWQRAWDQEAPLARRASGLPLPGRLEFFKRRGGATKLLHMAGGILGSAALNLLPVAAGFHLTGNSPAFARLSTKAALAWMSGPCLVSEDAGVGGEGVLALPEDLESVAEALAPMGVGSGSDVGEMLRAVVGHEIGHQAFMAQAAGLGARAEAAGFPKGPFEAAGVAMMDRRSKLAVWDGAGLTAGVAAALSGGNPLPWVVAHILADRLVARRRFGIPMATGFLQEGFADWFATLSPLSEGDVSLSRKRHAMFSRARASVNELAPMDSHATGESLEFLGKWLAGVAPGTRMSEGDLLSACFDGAFLNLSQALERIGRVSSGEWFEGSGVEGLARESKEAEAAENLGREARRAGLLPSEEKAVRRRP